MDHHRLPRIEPQHPQNATAVGQRALDRHPHIQRVRQAQAFPFGLELVGDAQQQRLTLERGELGPRPLERRAGGFYGGINIRRAPLRYSRQQRPVRRIARIHLCARLGRAPFTVDKHRPKAAVIQRARQSVPVFHTCLPCFADHRVDGVFLHLGSRRRKVRQAN